MFSHPIILQIKLSIPLSRVDIEAVLLGVFDPNFNDTLVLFYHLVASLPYFITCLL